METRANYVLIGLFTLAALFGGAAFVYWFQNLDGSGERALYRVVYQGSVPGLRTGSAVLFNGIRVGEVTDLRINARDSNQVIATVSVDAATPVRADTQAGLQFQGLTGVAAVSMQGGTLARTLPTSRDNPAILRASPELSQDITQSARDVLAKLDKFISDNEASLGASFRNIETVSGALARNTERFDRIMAGIENLTGGPEGKGDIQEAARSIKQLAESLDKRAVEITAGINRFSATGAREFEALSSEGRRTLAEIERAVRNLDRNPSRLLFGGSNSVPEYTGRR